MAVQQGDTVNGVEIRPMAGRDFQPVGSSASYDWAQATIVAPGYTYQAGDQIQFSLHGEHASIYGQPGVQTQSVSVDSVAHTADVKFQSSTPGSVTVSAVLTRDSSVSGSRIFTFMAIPIASRTTLGAVMVGDGLSITEPGVLSATGSSGAPYTLPPASAKTLGGVKQGGNVTIASDGTLSVAAPYTLPVATRNALGGVKQGTNVTIEADGTLSVAGGTAGTLPTASPSVKGGVKVGTGLSMNGETMSVAPATAMVVGGVKQGGNVTIAWDGTLSVAAPYTLPVATGNALGGVKQGTNVTIEADGTLSVAGGTAGTLPTASPSVKGGVKVGTGLSMNGETMSVAPATATAVGGVKLASASDVAAGTDSSKAVTPQGAKGVYAPLANPQFTGMPFALKPSDDSGMMVGMVPKTGSVTPNAPTKLDWSSVYLQLGGLEYAGNSYRMIGFGFSYGVSPPLLVGYQEKLFGPFSAGDFVVALATSNNGSVMQERFRVQYDGRVTINVDQTSSGYALADQELVTGKFLKKTVAQLRPPELIFIRNAPVQPQDATGISHSLTLSDMRDGDTIVADFDDEIPGNVFISCNYDEMPNLRPGARVYFPNPGNIPVSITSLDGCNESVSIFNRFISNHGAMTVMPSEQGVFQWMGGGKVLFYTTPLGAR